MTSEDIETDMREAVERRLAERRADAAQRRAARRERLAELHQRRQYGLQQRHATKLAQTHQKESTVTTAERQRLQAIDLVEHLLFKDRARYMAILLHTNPQDLAHEVAYLAALLVARLANDTTGDPEGLARSKAVLNELRADARHPDGG